MKDLAGKVAFITGGANGIGFGMVRAFLAEGMKVVVADWSPQNIEKAKARLSGNNAVAFVRTNVADRSDLKAAVDEALQVFGRIHVLCNNAGVNGGGTADDPEFDGWDKAMSVNLGGVINGSKLVVPIIKAQGEGGHVVCTSSMAERAASQSAFWNSLAPLGIGVSCLFPGASCILRLSAKPRTAYLAVE